MSYIGKKNIYRCHSCGHQTVTVDTDDGTTSYLINCTKPGCDGTARSSFYTVDQSLEATHEWVKPKAREVRKLPPHLRHHCELGGLLFRPIAKAVE